MFGPLWAVVSVLFRLLSLQGLASSGLRLSWFEVSVLIVVCRLVTWMVVLCLRVSVTLTFP